MMETVLNFLTFTKRVHMFKRKSLFKERDENIDFVVVVDK